MKTYASNFEVNTHSAYKGILIDILTEIKQYVEVFKREPTYIIISTADFDLLLKEMIQVGILPNRWRKDNISFYDIPIIQSLNFEKGCYDVVGS